MGPPDLCYPGLLDVHYFSALFVVAAFVIALMATAYPSGYVPFLKGYV